MLASASNTAYEMKKMVSDRVVLRRRHGYVGRQVRDLGIADVSAVEEGDEIEQAEPRDQDQIEPPDQLSVLHHVLG